MNQRKAGTLLSYAYIIITNTISLFCTPFMLRMMGQSEYGLYGTAAYAIDFGKRFQNTRKTQGLL